MLNLSSTLTDHTSLPGKPHGPGVLAATAKPLAADERRRHPRYPVELVAEVRDRAGGLWRAQVRDLCLGGALLARLDDDGAGELRRGTSLELRFDLATSHGIATAPVAATVVRVIDRSLGVQFDPDGGAPLESLRRFIDRMLAGSRGISGAVPARARPPTAEAARATVIVKRLTAKRIDDILKAWLDATAEAFWQGIDRASNGEEKQRLTDDSVRLAHLREGGALAALRERVQQDQEESATRYTLGTGGTTGLALVDNEGFETWLEIAGLVNRLEEELHESLQGLEAQLADILGPEARHQLLPKRLAEGLDAWGEAQGLTPTGRRLSLCTGRQILPRLLAGYFRDLSHALEQGGFPRVKSAVQRIPMPMTAATRGGPEREAAPISMAPRNDRAGPPSAASAAAKQPPVPAKPERRLTAAALSELLAGLPVDALKTGSGDSNESLEAQALSLFGEQALAASVRERIRVAEQMLGHLVGQSAVTERSAHWVRQLALRVLTAAIADPMFFRPPWHPLLQLLERLDHLALFLPTDPDADDSGLARKIEALVRRALAADARDRGAFHPLLAALEGLERQQSERFRREASRAICQLEGRDRRRAAHNVLRAGLEQRFGGRPMHPVVAELIDAAWATLLQLRYLREGEDGEPLARAWMVLERLVALCGGASAEEGADIDDLEAELAAGLTYVGFDPFLAQDLIARLREVIRGARDGRLGEASYPIYQPPAEPKTSAQAALAGIEPKVLAKLANQVDELGHGAVLRLRDAGSDRVLRLIWCSPDRAELALLDAHDGELRSFAREALLAGLHSGDIEVKSVTGFGLGDRAVDATLREMQERVRYHETRDRLTGLYNRHQFSRRLAEARAQDEAGAHLLGFLDIDHFDAINSTCGFVGGEQLLKVIARLIVKRLGAGATVAFLGGRRFGFFFAGDANVAPEERCEQLCRDVYGLRFEWQGQPYPVTASIGAVLANPGVADPDGLLSAAAIACTTAQENGGNRVQIFREDDEAIVQSRERLRWLAIAEEVIKDERVRLRVQMIAPVDSEVRHPSHHEVLMRVLDAQGEELDLGRFIAAAEAFNLMGEVDRLVIRKAIGWAGDNPEMLDRLGGIAINLSGVSLSDGSLPGFIRQQLEQRGVSPSLVSFEVTETAAIANMKRAAAIIQGIREIGCRVALDDFGAGMSSYTYLKSLPVDFVKIDGFFIRELLTNPHDHAIVKSMNEIAHFMGIQTIAEFAEHPGVIERLAEIGVDFVQGFAVRKPMFLDEIRADY